jgi:site-specific DNA-methyltransferase (adenine-specific)
MRTMKDKSVDLTVTSPPYDDLRTYGGYGWDFGSIARELFRITRDGGVVVWVVGDQTVEGSESLTSFKQAIYFVEQCGFNLHDTMIYAKRGFSNPSNNRYHQVFEYMFILSIGAPETFNPIKDKYNVVTRCGGDCTRQRDGKMKYGDRGGLLVAEYGQRYNIWEYTTGGGNMAEDMKEHWHPAIFPLSLAKDHIISWSNAGDVVLDCMMGSGTVGVACKLLRRNFIGCEISPKYFELAKRRIDSTEWGMFA